MRPRPAAAELFYQSLFRAQKGAFQQINLLFSEMYKSLNFKGVRETKHMGFIYKNDLVKDYQLHFYVLLHMLLIMYSIIT